MEPRLTFDLVADVRQVLEFPFMVNAFRAGAVVAVLAGLVGWFMVVRRQSFAGHTLAVVGFPGASGAVLLGTSATYGFFAFTLAAAALIAVAASQGGRPRSQESAVTGTVQAFALAAGYLFVSLSGGFVNGASALLFGSFLGITADQVLLLLAVAAVALVLLAAIARPLLFASVDPDVAAARGIPVRLLSLAFLLILALTAAAVSQVTGTLLVFALLVVPAASAQALSARPVVSAATAVAIGLAVTWGALFVAYYSPYPLGFYLTTFAFAAYLGSIAAARLRTSGPILALRAGG